MDLDTTTSRIREKLLQDGDFDATLRLELDGDGVIYLDGRSAPPTVSNEDREAQCTVRLSGGDLYAIMEGHLNPFVAFATGRLSVSGDLKVGLKLHKLVS